jgi:hypothetical protein
VNDGPTKYNNNTHGKMFKPLTSLLSSALAVAASCPTLRDLFPAEGLYEHNLHDFVVKSSHIVGDRDESQKFAYTDPGDQDLWYDNPLGSYIDGNVTDIVGTSSGVCNLLPPSANASQCLSVFTFQDYGTLVMSSIWPNNIVERGQLIIVGGTKCFKNVLGTISALGTDDTWEFWEYHLLNDDNNDCQDANLLEVFNSTYALSPWSSDTDQVMGDRNLWYENWLLSNNESVSNNADDSLAGLASGACTWLNRDVCIGLETFEFNNGNRITQVMFNVSEQQILGGTDCLLGEKGTVELVDDEFGMYRYSLQPVVKRSDCNDLSLEEILTIGLYEQRATRQAKLQDCVIASIVDVALNLVVAEWTRVKCDNPAAKLDLSSKALAYKVAHDYIHAHFNKIRRNVLKFDSLPDAEAALQKHRDEQGVIIGVVPETFNDETKWTYSKSKEKLIELFPKMSFDVFTKVSERNILRSIDTELSVMNSNAAASELNEATADAITADAPITKSTMGEFVTKQLDKFKKEMRSNFSADRKSHRPSAVKRGRKSINQSND